MEDYLESEIQQEKVEDVIEVATEAGHIMLENGAEISRVEETMRRIASHFGVPANNFFVLSNGIFTSIKGVERKVAKHSFASIDFIPIKGTRMDKIVATNSLSRNIEAGKCSLEDARAQLNVINAMKQKPAWEQILGSALGSAGFCAIFGGSLKDCLVSFVVGALIWFFVFFVASPYFSKTLGNLLSGFLVAVLCMALYSTGFGDSLDDIVVGSLIPLIPGVAFTNGIRDIANEDYISGMTRLMDAILVFMAITMGASGFFLFAEHITGNGVLLHGPVTDPLTATIPIQVAFAFIATIGFAILYSVPRSEYLSTGVVGMLTWLIYEVVYKFTILEVTESTLVAAIACAFMAYWTARIRKCPMTVFLICGLFPLIPGGGIFWTTYFLVSGQFAMALSSGMTALSVTIAIVLGIVIYTGMPKLRRGARKSSRP